MSTKRPSLGATAILRWSHLLRARFTHSTRQIPYFCHYSENNARILLTETKEPDYNWSTWAFSFLSMSQAVLQFLAFRYFAMLLHSYVRCVFHFKPFMYYNDEQNNNDCFSRLKVAAKYPRVEFDTVVSIDFGESRDKQAFKVWFEWFQLSMECTFLYLCMYLKKTRCWNFSNAFQVCLLYLE